MVTLRYSASKRSVTFKLDGNVCSMQTSELYRVLPSYVASSLEKDMRINGSATLPFTVRMSKFRYLMVVAA